MNYRHVLTAAALCTIALGVAGAQQGDKKAPVTQQAKPDSAKKDSKTAKKASNKKGSKKAAEKKDSTKAPAKKP